MIGYDADPAFIHATAHTHGEHGETQEELLPTGHPAPKRPYYTLSPHSI